MLPAGKTLATISLVTALTLAVGGGVASAAPIGGITTAKLTALTMAASTGAPTVVAWENFNGTNGTNLNGTVTDGGAKTWSVNPAGGAWTIQGNGAQSTTPNSSLVIDAGAPSRSVSATIFRNGATTFDVGLTINRNAAGTEFLTAEWTNTANGSMELWKFSGGAWTEVDVISNLYPGGIATAPASITLTLSSLSTGALTAFINGVQVVTYTLTAAEQTLFKNAAHQLAGPYQWLSNGLRFDDFHLDNP